MRIELGHCRPPRRCWLLLPVLILCLAPRAHGGLAIGLVDADYEQACVGMTSTQIPAADHDGESRVENDEGDMLFCRCCNVDDVQQLALIEGERCYDNVGRRLDWKLSRVKSYFRRTPPLNVPIGLN